MDPERFSCTFYGDSFDLTQDGFNCIRLQSEEQGKDYSILQQPFFSESEMAQHATPKVNLVGTFSAHSFYINDWSSYYDSNSSDANLSNFHQNTSIPSRKNDTIPLKSDKGSKVAKFQRAELIWVPAFFVHNRGVGDLDLISVCEAWIRKEHFSLLEQMTPGPTCDEKKSGRNGNVTWIKTWGCWVEDEMPRGSFCFCCLFEMKDTERGECFFHLFDFFEEICKLLCVWCVYGFLCRVPFIVIYH